MARRQRSSAGELVFDLGNYLAIFVFIAACMFPFVHMFAVSVSDFLQVGMNNVTVVPIVCPDDTSRLPCATRVGIDLRVYRELFVFNPFIFRAYFNSIFYTGLTAFLAIILNSMGGYALALRQLGFRWFFGGALLLMMFFSGGIIAEFLWMRELGLLNTFWPVVLIPAVVPLYVFIFRIYIRTNVSVEVMESVYVDGGGDVLVYTRIVLPLITPIIATIGLFAAVSQWNSFFSALIYLSDREKYPLTLFLREMVVLGQFGGASRPGPIPGTELVSAWEAEGERDFIAEVWNGGFRKAAKMAFTLVTVLPILLVYPLAQRYFVKGIMIGALKD